MISARRRLPLACATLGAALLATALAPTAAHATGGTSYYVSTTGSDANSGTSSGAPFRHVQKCADVMVAGDTCRIAAGTYREKVTPVADGTAAQRITYVAAPGARVVVDGSDIVGGWAPVTGGQLSTLQTADPTLVGSEFASAVGAGHVYRAAVSPAAGVGRQLFVDDAMQPEAAWPHAGNNPAEPALASAQSGTTTSLSDSASPNRPAGGWVRGSPPTTGS